MHDSGSVLASSRRRQATRCARKQGSLSCCCAAVTEAGKGRDCEGMDVGGDGRNAQVSVETNGFRRRNAGSECGRERRDNDDEDDDDAEARGGERREKERISVGGEGDDRRAYKGTAFFPSPFSLALSLCLLLSFPHPFLSLCPACLPCMPFACPLMIILHDR